MPLRTRTTAVRLAVVAAFVCGALGLVWAQPSDGETPGTSGTRSVSQYVGERRSDAIAAESLQPGDRSGVKQKRVQGEGSRLLLGLVLGSIAVAMAAGALLLVAGWSREHPCLSGRRYGVRAPPCPSLA